MTKKPTRHERSATIIEKANALKRLQTNRRAINIKLSADQTADLLAITMALQANLRAVLDHLAVEHGMALGPWLDDLENELISNASNIWAQGPALEVEVRAVTSARNVIKDILAALRERLEQEQS